MSMNIYLAFDGNCQEAFDFYRSIFGGDFSEVQTFAKAPPEMGVAEADKDRIMHISLPIGSSVLMGSDSPAAFGPPPVVGNNFSIAIEGKSKEHCNEICTKLSAGGTLKMPMEETFWGAYFGRWTDKFDINWMINYELPKD